jgi:hypothetical protein
VKLMLEKKLPKRLLLAIIGLLVLVVAGILAPRAYLYLWPPPARNIRLPPSPTTSPTRLPSRTPQATETPTPAGGMSACNASLSEMLKQTATASSPEAGTPSVQDTILVTYAVDGDTLKDRSLGTIPEDLQALQEDVTRQAAIWHFVTDVLPADQRTRITKFELFTDGLGNSLGSVMRTANPHNWMLRLDIVDAADFASLSTTLIHEFGHLLTLNDSQVNISYQPTGPLTTPCPNYSMPEGCSRSEAYINRFFQRFWQGIYLEWEVINTEKDPQVLHQKLRAFYNEYSDQFVDPYAVTDPGEDIAESWMVFIFTTRPAGNTVAEEKILFFYEYPELVALRTSILDHLCSYVK